MKYNNKVSAATIARTAALMLALANQILSAFGKSPLPIESSTVEQLVTTGITTPSRRPLSRAIRPTRTSRTRFTKDAPAATT